MPLQSAKLAEVELRGRQEFARFVEQIRAAFPDIRVKIERIWG